MSRSARMQDVARLAGVATMTVSRVINGSTHVSAELRQRVFDAIETLNYRPNTVARSLREQRSRQIGVIVPNLHDPFFAVCAQAVSMVAKQHEYSVCIAMSNEEPHTEYDEACWMLQRNIEGLIVIPASARPSRLAGKEFEGFPIVCLDRPIAGSTLDSVVVKNAEGAEVAVQHLIEHGHTRIVQVGLPLHLYTMKRRHAGYVRAMQRAGLAVESYVCSFAGEDDSEILSILRGLARGKDGVTAIFCSNNLTTRSVLHGLAKLGRKVPDEIALAGFDDFETADIINPAVTVVGQPNIEMGRCGADLLFSRLNNKKGDAKAQQVVLPVHLILRDSCGAHPAVAARAGAQRTK